MTDNEIKKAFECCYVKGRDCINCPAVNIDCVNVEKNFFDLFNRQKAEISVLRKLLDKAETEMNNQSENMKKLTKDCYSMQSTLAKMSMGVEQAKAEAIKEVVGKTQAFLAIKCRGVVEDNPNLDEILWGYRREDVDDFFENLMKEMVGDTE